MSILIIGATGNIGKETVNVLLEKGIQPVLGVRNPERAKQVLGDKPKYVSFDFDEPSTFRQALKGIERLFFIAPHHDPVPSVMTLLNLARIEGVEHIVFSSGRTTGDIAGKPLNKVELLVENCGLNYTIIRPGWFMQNFASWLGTTIPSEGKFYLPAGSSKTAFIDVRDIGAVIATVLIESGHNEQKYALTSDEAIDHFEVARLLSKATGKNIEYIAQDRATYIETMMARSWPETTAEYTAALYDIVLTGKEEEISPDVERIIGRKPIRFEQFAEDHKSVWE